MPKKKLKRSRSSYRSFEEAKKFVAQLGINSHLDWRRFAHSGTMPPDIPVMPYLTYKKEWKGWDNFLGFEDAINQKIWKKFDALDFEKIAKKLEKDTQFLEPFPKIPKTEYSAKNRAILKKQLRKKFGIDVRILKLALINIF